MIAEKEQGPSLRETLEKSVQEASAPEPSPVTAPAPAPSEAPAPAPAPSPIEEKPYLEPQKTEPASQDTTTPVAKEPEDAQSTSQPVDQNYQRPPQSWKPVAKSHWDKLPDEVKADVHRREREIVKVLNSSSDARKFQENMAKLVAPYEDRYRQSNIPNHVAIQNLMSADRVLATAPAPQRAMFMAKMIKDYQIDIEMLDSALSGEDVIATNPMARIDDLISRKLAPLTQFVDTQRQTHVSQQHKLENDLATELQAMESDTTNYPYFHDVRADMADMVEIYSRRGVYLTPKEAYNRAVRSNPETSKLLQQNVLHGQAQNANAQAQRSLNASSSVTGSPAALSRKPDPADLRGTIEAAWESHAGR